MAVEARHINPFPSQLMSKGNLTTTTMDGNNQEANAGVSSSYNPQLLSQQIRLTGNAVNHLHHQRRHPFAAAATATLPHLHNPTICGESSSLYARTESGLTCNNNDLSRKRLRETDQFPMTPISVLPPAPPATAAAVVQYSSSLLGGDFLPQMLRQHQYDLGTLISQHTKRIRLELAEKQRQQSRSLASAISGAAAAKLKEKEDQIARMGKMNMALQERLKSLYVENQLWRDLAQTNEATANSLRTDLEQVLMHPSGEDKAAGDAVGDEDDAESCCGSNDVAVAVDRRCKMCGEREPCVLLLPCRHLCLCGVCGGGGGSQAVKVCPVCNSSMNATLHVNMSSSS